MNHVKRVIPMSDTSVSIKPEDIQPTVLPDAFIQSDIVRKLNTLSLPRYDQLPNVTLYRSGQKAIWPRANCPPDRYLHL